MHHMKKEPAFILHFLISLLLSYGFTTLCILILSFLLYKFHISLKIIDIAIVLIFILSNGIGGYICSSKLNKRKFLGGLFLGLLYFFVFILLSLIVNKGATVMPMNIFTNFLLCAASGMMGGCLHSSKRK